MTVITYSTQTEALDSKTQAVPPLSSFCCLPWFLPPFHLSSSPTSLRFFLPASRRLPLPSLPYRGGGGCLGNEDQCCFKHEMVKGARRSGINKSHYLSSLMMRLPPPCSVSTTPLVSAHFYPPFDIGWEEVMNYRIPRAMRLAANYPVKNDPFLHVSVCVCVKMCVFDTTSWNHTSEDSYASNVCLYVQNTGCGGERPGKYCYQ